ncbi:MAG: phosphoribosyltransferase [Chloroflexi bacterium]|nr:phosphoribosyltransferase [Chloroflexota bacterium]
MVLQMTLSEATPVYQDRQDAGRQLAERLAGYADNRTVIFAIPRGGLLVAAETARQLKLPLDVVLTRKMPVTFDPETGYGAVADDGSSVFNRLMVRRLGVGDKDLIRQTERLKAELERSMPAYRGSIPFPRLVSRTAIIVDDGMASGYTMAAAIKCVRSHRAGRVVVAVPVAPELAYQMVKTFADAVICPMLARSSWFSVGAFYQDWHEVTDKEAISVLAAHRKKFPLERVQTTQRPAASGHMPIAGRPLPPALAMRMAAVRKLGRF